jgi:PAS domain S-box-containing protein
MRDVTERKLAEQALRASEASYRSLILGATYGIFRCSVEGKFVTVNPALVAMLGYESEAELLAANLVNDISQSADAGAQLLRQYRQKGRVDGMEGQWKRKDGRPITVRLSGRAVLDERGALQGFEIIAEDVTERRQLEQQLRQAQKMEAIGQLAGGVAHDFNNLLTIITGFGQLVSDSIGCDHPLRKHVDEIVHAGERAAAVTRQLLAFSRRQVLTPRVLDLNSVVVGMGKMLTHLIAEDIQLETQLEKNLGRVKADPGQIEQVIMNLAVNARDAMPQGGKLIIETANVELDEAYERRHGLPKTGPFVTLAVSDTGCGMEAETQSHIFEPFFTTKEQSKGTGLGLATVYGIVKQTGGDIWIYSEPGRGSTFKVYLPRVEEAAETVAPAQPDGRAACGSETILLVEDEEGVRKLARSVLEAKGYRVLEAGHGEEALKVAQAYQASIDLLLADMVMPQMSGSKLAHRLIALRPSIRVIFMSGYSDKAALQQEVLGPGTPFLQKPFTPDSLARKVREVLDANHSQRT